MCGPRPHRQKPTPGRIPKAVRQTGDPSGPPASRTPESGKNGPSGQGLPRSGAVGAGSNTSAHYVWTPCAFNPEWCNMPEWPCGQATISSPGKHIMAPMIGQRSFGKLGNRKAARLAIEIDAGLVMPERSVRCRLENISRTGCRLQLSDPPRVGATIMVRAERIQALGTVSWVRANRCGIKFSQPLEGSALERMRWIIENSSKHQQNSLSHATAIWR